ncbi:hypothetical protein [Haladaptatus cibarius]|uniref:hypothetical protein n=1 Tax=Haladaptatus cibarius TaxID=453847 RepID=UPI000679A4A8|nr:hypothetical protein [Haladaptatus cibarius]
MASGTAKVVITLSVFAAVGLIMLSPVNSTVTNNTGSQAVLNDSHGVGFDESIDLRGYNIDPGSETVYGYNDTSESYEVASASDYTLDDGSGTLDLNSSSTLFDEGEDVKVSYDYQASDDLTTLVVGFIPVGMGVLIFFGIASAVEGMV